MPIFAALSSALPSIVSTGGGIAGSLINGGNSAAATKAALAAQEAAAQQGIGAIQNNQGLNAQLLAPYLNSGNAALSQLTALLGLGSPGAAPGVAQASQGAPNWAAYVQNNPDVLQAYNTIGKSQGTSLEDFGKWHWNTFGQTEANSGDPNRVFTPYGPAGQSAAPAGTGAAAVDPQAAIDALKAGPVYQSQYHNGEQAVLANAAATGGLRGGNAEASLYNLGANTLASVYQQQVGNLAGLAGAGQSGANSLAGLNTSGSNSIASILTGQGNNAASAGLLGAGIGNQMNNQLINGLSSIAGNSQFQQLLSSLGLGGGVSSGGAGASQFSAPLSLNTAGMNMPSLPQLAF